MPKLKTHSGAKKRFRLTASGKIKRGAAYKSHNLEKHKKPRKKALNAPHYVNACDANKIKKLLPYT